jgi:hypothetical protein
MRVQMIENSIEVVGYLGGQLDPCHPQRASFRAVGRLAFLPASRFSR